MEKTFGSVLIESLNKAVAHAKGKAKAARERVVQVPMSSLREGLKMSQHLFASTYHIPLATLKGWEQGRRQPDATAAAYLSVIEKMPAEAQAVLKG